MSFAVFQRQGKNRGHRVQIIEAMHYYKNMTSSHPTICHRVNNLCDFDAIISINGAPITSSELQWKSVIKNRAFSIRCFL
ncbi:MAG: hypothetical protein ACM3KR_08090 [Deltaproteobacteria bacterium]